MKAIRILNITGIKNKRFWAFAGLFSVFFLAILFFLAWMNAFVFFHQGEKNLQSKNYEKAALSFEQAVLFQFPGSPFQDRSVNYLFSIGDRAAAERNIPLALQAYHGILFSKASLSVYKKTSLRDSLQAMEKIRKINPQWIGPEIPENFPNRFWALILGVALLAWVGSLFLFIGRGFDQAGKFLLPAALVPLGVFSVSFLIWILAITRL